MRILWSAQAANESLIEHFTVAFEGSHVVFAARTHVELTRSVIATAESSAAVGSNLSGDDSFPSRTLSSIAISRSDQSDQEIRCDRPIV
ncbi:unnamed protein product [Nippostrongylus brasiliensis]|uniref:Uncharacterized protein n=1 Tax=Nippostrongylus brasiliensis TaxID=27835 RepID=A0A0N4YD40_NIPBR|nr:unnamed protein product [Nippostrongylus brasiliensis]